MSASQPHGDRWPPSPPWSAAWRLWAITAMAIALVVVWWNVRQFTVIVVTALLLAYLLDPLIRRCQRGLRLRRAHAVLLVYTLLAVTLGSLTVALAPAMARGLLSLDPAAWQRTSAEIIARLPNQATVLERQLDLTPLLAQLEQQVQAAEAAVLGRESLVWLLGFATDFAFTLLGILFTLVASVYLALDADKIMRWLELKVPEPYRPAYHVLRRDIGRVWQSFFRGQLVLVVVVAVATASGLLLLGLPYALPLGMIAGALEVVPRVGPTLSVLPAAAVALTQPSATMPDLPKVWFVGAVVGLYVVIQQIENTVLVPRVIGSRVRLPPAVVLVGALMGASLAGVMGMLLAPPVIGSMRIIGSWLYAKATGTDGPPHEPPGSGSGGAAAGSTPAGAEVATAAPSATVNPQARGPAASEPRVPSSARRAPPGPQSNRTGRCSGPPAALGARRPAPPQETPA